MAWNHARWCAVLEAEGPRLAELTRVADPELPVPTCPGWTVARLVRHLGRIHRWAEASVRERATERLDPRQLELRWPESWSSVPGWLAEGVRSAAGTLRGADPDLPVWAWGSDNHVRFWSRRLTHETAVHRTDLEQAIGQWPEIEAELAVDGIDELLSNLPARASFTPALAELRGHGESIHLHATDGPGEWVIHLSPGGFSVEHGHVKATTAVQGRSSDLLLMLYRRLPLDDPRYRRFGDQALIRRWLELTAF
jgi:uncharacterized protein (TIGR03083 family)